MPLKQLENLLREKIGLHAESLGAGAIETAVRARSAACKVSGIDGYVRHLKAHPEELNWLIDEIVVNETWFFREPSAFEYLRQRYLTTGNPTSTYQVLSLPCATGEEAYSIAMTLHDAPSKRRFEVHGIDVSANALETAMHGDYRKISFRGGMNGYEHHFETSGSHLRVKREIRDLVQFSRGNVLDPLLCAGMRFDAVFCRNLLIYLDRPARQRALQNLQRLLFEDGVLFAGHSETGEVLANGFRRTGDARNFAFAKRGSGTMQAVAPPSAPERPTRATQPRLPAAPGTRPSAATAATNAARAKGDSGTYAFRSRTDLDEARELADRGELEAARKLCESHLSRRGPSAEGFSLLGIIRHAARDVRGALESFGKALYLDPAHYESLVHTALIHEHAGNTEEAANFRQRAERAMRKVVP